MSVCEMYTMAGVVARRGEEEGEFVKLLGPGLDGGAVLIVCWF